MCILNVDKSGLHLEALLNMEDEDVEDDSEEEEGETEEDIEPPVDATSQVHVLASQLPPPVSQKVVVKSVKEVSL
jgi:hypothetical protein